MQPNMNSEVEDVESENKYLLFRLANEVYGVQLRGVKEVIKQIGIKSVPFTVPHFKGVINLRGQIVSVIDLREKFSLSVSKTNPGLILVVEHSEGLLGAVVDDLISVLTLEEKDIDRSPILETKIPMQFFLGVAKNGDSLVNLVNVAGVVSSEDYRVLKNVIQAA